MTDAPAREQTTTTNSAPVNVEVDTSVRLSLHRGSEQRIAYLNFAV